MHSSLLQAYSAVDLMLSIYVTYVIQCDALRCERVNNTSTMYPSPAVNRDLFYFKLQALN